MIVGISLIPLFVAHAQESAAELFEEKCASCHVKVRPSDISSLIAPPIKGVMRHVKMRFTCKEDAVKFITSYVMKPEKSQAVCEPDKIKRFGLMPSQKGNLSEEELTKISEWLFDNFPRKMSKKEGCLEEYVPSYMPQESTSTLF